MDVETTTLSEDTTQKDKYHMVSLMSGLQTVMHVNFLTKQKQSRENKHKVTKGERDGGLIRNLVLTDTHCYI